MNNERDDQPHGPGGDPSERDAQHRAWGRAMRTRREDAGGVSPETGAPSFAPAHHGGETLSDDRVREEVCGCLAADHFIDASQIEVAVSDGEVTLSGAVQTGEAQRRAAALIDAVRGVRRVDNQLRVLGSSE